VKILVLRVTPASPPTAAWWPEGDVLIEHVMIEDDPALDLAREMLSNKAIDATWDNLLHQYGRGDPRAFGVFELYKAEGDPRRFIDSLTRS